MKKNMEMGEAMRSAIRDVVEFAWGCGEFSQHWVNAKNFAVRRGADKEVAKEAVRYVLDNAAELNVKVKLVPHGPHLSPAPYFAGKQAEGKEVR